MAIAEIKKALETHLASLSPSVSTAYEGTTFNPTAGTMYQRVQYLIRPPTDPTRGTGYHRENIQMQIFVATENNKGTGAAITRAELIRNHFAKGTYLYEAPCHIHVLRTPQIGSAVATSDRLIVPVLIEVTGEVSD